MDITDGKGNTTGIAANPLVTTSSPNVGGLPSGATLLIASSGNLSAASAVATLTATAAKTTYITGFEITGGGATVASIVTAVLSGIIGGAIGYNVGVALGSGVGNAPLVITFNPPIPASAVNTPIVMTVPSYGTGNVSSTVTLHGYQI